MGSLLKSCPIVILLSFPAAVLAQQTGNHPGPPDAPLVDENHVLMPADFVSVSFPQVAVGESDGLAHSLRNSPSAGSTGLKDSCDFCRENLGRSGFYKYTRLHSSLEGGLSLDTSFNAPRGSSWTFSYGGITERFTASWDRQLTQNGGAMVETSTQYIYRDKFGNEYLMEKGFALGGDYQYPVRQINYADGTVVKIVYEQVGNIGRLKAVHDNVGNFIKFEYQSNAYSQSNPSAYLWFNRIIAGNKAHAECDLSSSSCVGANLLVATNSWNSGFTEILIGNASNNFTKVKQTPYQEIASITYPGASSPAISYTYCSRTTAPPCSWFKATDVDPSGLPGSGSGWVVYPGMVLTATREGATTQYSSTQHVHEYHWYTSYSDSLKGTRRLYQRGNPYDYYVNGAYTSFADYDDKKWFYTGDVRNLITGTADAEGNSKTFKYDTRGNISSIVNVPKSGSPLAEVVEIFTYSTSCSNLKICNKPQSYTDGKGYVTNFEYDPGHGSIIKKIMPADANGVRMEIRYSYAEKYAWFKSGSGFVRSPSPVWKLVSEQFCRTSNTTANGDCAAGPSDKVVTAYQYEEGSSAKGSSLRHIGTTVTADNETRRTCYSYDHFGRKISETSPSAALAICS